MIDIALFKDFKMQFIKDCKIDFSNKEFQITRGNQKIPLLKLPNVPSVKTSLKALQSDGISQNSLAKKIAIDNVPELKNLSLVLHQKCLIQYIIEYNKQSIAKLEPLAEDWVESFSRQQKFDKSKKWKLSKFALVRVVNGGLKIESPLSKCSLEILDMCFWQLIFLLSEEIGLAEAKKKLNLKEEQILFFLHLLEHCQFLETKKNQPVKAVDHWSFHDLYFHSRSRMGRHNNPVGGNYPFKGISKPLPVVKDPPKGKQIQMPIPNPYYYTNRDIPFTQVIEGRRSWRQPNQFPVNFYLLSEFLFRAARIRSIFPGMEGQEHSNRPYPNGGACYELEIYLTIDRCYGLAAGFYYYDPKQHTLILIKKANSLTKAMLDDANWATGQAFHPAMLIHVAARFQRVSWKYDSIAYSLILKNTGILFNNLYLVATAMGLGPCAVGLGNADRFAKLAEVDYYEESSVGEFILN